MDTLIVELSTDWVREWSDMNTVDGNKDVIRTICKSLKKCIEEA